MSGFKNSFIGLITLFSILLSSLAFSQATFFTNLNVGGGDWDDPSAWLQSGFDTDGIPDADDIVIIGSGAYITVSNVDAACDDLTIADDGSITEVGIDAGLTLTVNGRLIIVDSADFAEILIVIDGTLNVLSV